MSDQQFRERFSKLRIGIMGPAGSGKTSLAQDLARGMAVPALDEGMRDLYLAKSAFLQLEKNSESSLDQRRLALKKWMDEHFRWAKSRAQQYKENSSFVADRWEADLLMIWTGNFGAYNLDEDTVRLMRILTSASENFDFVILTPLGPDKSKPQNEDGLVRRASLASQLATRTLALSYTQQLTKVPIIVLPGKTMSNKQRIDYVQTTVRENDFFANHGKN